MLTAMFVLYLLLGHAEIKLSDWQFLGLSFICMVDAWVICTSPSKRQRDRESIEAIEDNLRRNGSLAREVEQIIKRKR
jgi:hypothetical protein